MTTGQIPPTPWPQVNHNWRHDHRSNTTDVMTTSQTPLTSWPQVKYHWRNEHKSSTTDVMTTGQTPLLSFRTPIPTPRVKVSTNPSLASKFHRLVHYNCPEFLYLIKSESHDMAGIKIKNKQKHTTLSEQFKYPIEKSYQESTLIPLTNTWPRSFLAWYKHFNNKRWWV
jgi:hypothetical protein